MTLKESLADIHKQFGKGSAFRLGDGESLAVEVIPIGIPSLDRALGVGGFPRGRIIEIYGPESGGKSTLAMHLIAAAQKAGGQAAYVDVEHSFDPRYGKVIGMDVENLIVSQPDYGEQALEITNSLVKSGDMDVIVIDSVAALVPKAELEGDVGQPQMGLQARLMSQGLRMLTGNVSKSKVILVFINQLRDKIGVMFGNPETTTGGKALKFYASLRLDVRRKEVIKDGDRPVGAITRIKVVKNKVAAPFGEAELVMIYGEGFSAEADLLEVAVEKSVVSKEGTWYTICGDRRQGKEQARLYLKEHPEAFKKVYEAVRKVDK
jgi:recombination protein RecA